MKKYKINNKSKTDGYGKISKRDSKLITKNSTLIRVILLKNIPNCYK